MNFIFSEEQLQLQEIARRFCAEHSNSASVRALLDDTRGYDENVWSQMMAMGWGAIAVPEQYGGLGLGQLEVAIVQQEMGRRLMASPFLSSICLAVPALVMAGTTEQRERWLPALLGGGQTAALACTGMRGRAGLDNIEAQLTATADGNFKLSGAAGFVVFGHSADAFIIAARAPHSSGEAGISLIMLPRASAGLRVEKVNAMDLTRPYAKLAFDDVLVPATALLGEPQMAGPILARILALGAIALAAEQVGGAEYVLTMSVEYAKQRVQFGRAIGSFQAVKHKLADMMVLVEAAKSATYYAACAADEDPAQLFEAAAVAKSFCADAFMQCAGAAIQLHGGIGFTWEHDAHLYFKRARASNNLLGDTIYQREQLAQQLLDGEQPLLRQLRGQ